MAHVGACGCEVRRITADYGGPRRTTAHHGGLRRIRADYGASGRIKEKAAMRSTIAKAFVTWYLQGMKKRQIKKIIDTYYWDTEADIMLPPSVVREELKAEEVYFSKAFIISNPEKAAEYQKLIQERIEAETKKAQELDK